MRLQSWQLDINRPASPKYVLIGAPHTSNLDLTYGLILKYAGRIDLHWVGKDSAFRGPLGPIYRRLGGIPVNRRVSQNFVEQMVEQFNQRERFILAIAPEGTRHKAPGWKSGFYYIALGAGVPIALGFIDYGRKRVGVGPTIHPSGDIQADFKQIAAFYSGMVGRYPERQGEIKLERKEG